MEAINIRTHYELYHVLRRWKHKREKKKRSSKLPEDVMLKTTNQYTFVFDTGTNPALTPWPIICSTLGSKLCPDLNSASPLIAICPTGCGSGRPIHEATTERAPSQPTKTCHNSKYELKIEDSPIKIFFIRKEPSMMGSRML